MAQYLSGMRRPPGGNGISNSMLKCIDELNEFIRTKKWYKGSVGGDFQIYAGEMNFNRDCAIEDI